MESINERELGIVGERYGSFLEAYRANDRRSLNAQVAGRGDGLSQGLVEADTGIMFAPEDTRRALLYGSDLYAGRYKEMRKRVQRTLLERYEWMDESRFGADVRGGHVIMERYAIGHPEAFHRKRHTVRRERSVAILYDAMCPASTPVAKRIEAGCIVAACADALERMGYEVAIDFCLATYDGNSMSDDPTLLLEVALKDYGDALNVKRLEFPLAAKPVLFHLGVWWAHRFPSAPSDFGAGEGYPVSYNARRVKAMKEFARRRHGAYLSEDILEVQLGMDPTRALERILGTIGEEGELEQHMVQKTTMQASVSPAQGKLFGGVRGSGERPGEGGDGARKHGAQQDGEGAGEVRVDGGEDADGIGGADGAGAGDGDDAMLDSDDGAPGVASRSSSGDEGAHAPGQTGRPGSHEATFAVASVGDGQQSSGRVPQAGDVGAEEPTTGDRTSGGTRGSSEDDGVENPGGNDRARGDTTGVDNGADNDDGDPSGTDDGSGTAGSGGGASTPSGAGSADSPGGGGSGEERPSDDEDESENEEDEDDDEQGESMSDDTCEQQEQHDSDDADQNEEQPPEDQRSEHAADDDEEQGHDSFIVELRKRYVRFERGDYRRAKERETRAAVGAKDTGGAAGRRPVQAPPAAPVTGADDYEFGTPRSTPFSMNYVPKRKG